MKLPGISGGGGRRRSKDPLGDPFEGLDLDSDATVPLARRGGSGGASGTAGGGGTGGGSLPDTDVELDLDPYPAADRDRASAKGLLGRLFGGDGGARPPRYGDLDDLDGAPLERRNGKGRLIGGALVAGLLAAGGLWAWQAGVFGGGSSPDTPMAESETDADAGSGEDPGAIPRLTLPDRVVLALPSEVQEQPSLDGGEDVVPDPTAATDRSVARRPWLSGGADGPDQNQGAGDNAGATAEGHDGGHDGAHDGAHDMAGDTTAAHTEPNAAPDISPDASPDASPDVAHDPDQHPADTPPDHAAPDHMAGSTAPGEAATPADTPTEGHAADHANPWQAMSEQGATGDAAGHDTPDPTEGVRARVDLAAPEIALPDIPGLLPVPEGVEGVQEPPAPNPLTQRDAVPSYAQLPKADGTRGNPLPSAPRRALQAPSPHGLVPAVADDGTPPWKAYAARDTAVEGMPRVAIVVRGLGMMTDALDAAVTSLPPPVTLAFTPYARNLPEKVGLARDAGHEILIELPMQGETFTAIDPGPLGLLTLLPEPELLDRLQQILTVSHGAVGVLAATGSGFVAAPEPMEPVMDTVRRSGLLYLHQGPPTALIANRRVLPPLTAVDMEVDRHGFSESIDARLSYLTRVAKARGFAVGTLSASPLGFARLQAWAEALPKAGVALAPLSSVVARGANSGPAPGISGGPAHDTPATTEADHEGTPDHG